MNRLPIDKRAQIIGMLVEGMSMRAASRLADVSINTITKLLSDVGTAWCEPDHADGDAPVHSTHKRIQQED